MDQHFLLKIQEDLAAIREAGLYKEERQISSPQEAKLSLENGSSFLNFCSNNYLGLANHPLVKKAAKEGIDSHGFGLSSVRFICGTQDIHKKLERKLSDFLKMEDCILYSSCFDANAGLFETLLGPEDAIISDSLNHASIIDGVRLCKAARFRYKNNDLEDLEEQLKKAKSARFRLIVTDGVFSMDGIIANLKGVCDLADRYQALVMVDDSHAVGFIGDEGRGSHEFADVMGRVDIITGTLGKALGGASGGYTAARKEIVEFLRQRSRPYLFSNSLAPAVVAASLAVLDLIKKSGEQRKKLEENSFYFRKKMAALGFDLLPGEHPIIPVMLGDAKLAKDFAEKLLERGVYVVAFSYPVVPKRQARIRCQMSAVHSKEDLDFALGAFEAVARSFGML